MSFAAPLFLLAALAGLIPVVFHLIHRRKAQEMRFSTLRLLRISVERTRRRKYVEDLSLLIVRVAVLLLIAVGLAGPALTGLAALWGGGRASAVAIVLDNSASMALTSEGRARFEAAREGAGMVLDRLREGDLVALLPTGGPPAPELGRLLRGREAVRQALDQCRISYERADLAVMIRKARALLARAEAPIKEIYIFTDNQALSWEGLKPTESGADAQESGGALQPPVILVDLSGDPVPNVALRSIAMESPASVAGALFQTHVEIVNEATVPQQKHLMLFVDGTRTAVSPTLHLPPGGTVRHDFSFTLENAGVHRGEVRLAEDDGSPLDNRLYFAATLDQQIPVAIVKPRRDEVPQADDAYYLERALAPAGSTVGAFRVTILTPESIGAGDLSSHAVIFCVNLPALTPFEADRLCEYVRNGGHLVWICGRNVQPAAYNAMNAVTRRDLLPAMLDELRQPLPGGVESWHVGFLDKNNPALGPLTEPASIYQSILVYKHFVIRWGTQEGGRVLAGLDDGQPLLVERPVGSGWVLLLGTSVHVEWTNLPIKPIFLPLITRLVFHLAGAEAERTFGLAGAPMAIPIGMGKEVDAARKSKEAVEIDVVRPSGEELRLRESDPAARTFRYTDTHEAGVYLVRLVNRNPARALGFAVNLDPAEVDPATISRQELEARFGRSPLIYCENPAELPGVIQRLNEGTSLWDWFLSAVLIGLVFEVFLANRGMRAALPQPPLAGLAGPSSVTPPVGPTTDSSPVAPSVAAIPPDDLHRFLEHLEHDAERAD